MNDNDLETRIREDLRAVADHPVPERLVGLVATTTEGAKPAAPRRWWPRALGGLAAGVAAVVLIGIAVSLLPPRSGPAATATPPASRPLGAASTDDWTGLRWSAPALTTPYDSIADIVPWKGGYVAVGQHQITTGSGGSQAEAWISPDARTWTRTLLDVPAEGDSTLGRLSVIGGRLIAVGSSGVLACTGPAGEGQTCAPAPIAIWTSEDGRSWVRQTTPPALGGLQVRAMAADGKTLLLVGDSGWAEPRILTSADGIAWQRVALPDDVFAAAHFEGLAATPSGFVLTGFRGGSQPDCCVNSGVTGRTGAAWTSADGDTWAAAALTTESGALGPDLGRVFAGRDGLVSLSGSNAAYSWRSVDGRSWELAPKATGGGVMPFASDGQRMVGVAYADGGSETWWTSTDGRTWQALATLGDAGAAPAWDSTHGPTADAAFMVPGGLIVIGQNGTERFPVWFALAVTGDVRPRPTPSSDAVGVVPWIDATPAPYASPTNAPVPVGTPACVPDELTAVSYWGGATGSMAGGVTVTNSGSTTCQLEGPPQKAALLAGDFTVPVEFRASKFTVNNESEVAPPVLLRPGDRASSFMVWSNYCPVMRPAVTTVLVTLPDGSGTVSAPVDSQSGPSDPRCDAPNQPSTLDAFAFKPVADESTTPEPQPVEVTIDAPATAAAGSVLRFRVAVTNLGAAAVSLDPCPGYAESLVVDGRLLKPPAYQQHVLNCAAIGSAIDPGDTVVLEMQYAIPSSVPSGSVELSWGFFASDAFDPSTSSARAPIAITGG